MLDPVSLIVVRRGETALFQTLLERFAGRPTGARVIWDRRRRDRRVIIRDDILERRRLERRAPPPPSWSAAGYLVVPRGAPGSPAPARPTEPTERERGTAPRPAAWGRAAVACRRLSPRGLRADAASLRRYARQLRQAGHPLNDWLSVPSRAG